MRATDIRVRGTSVRGTSVRGMRRALVILPILAGAMVILLPLGWMVSTSFKDEFAVFRYPPSFIPETFRFENYLDVFRVQPLARQYFNSLYISVLSVVGTVVVASLAGYALARLRFPGRSVALLLILSGLLLPVEVIIVPLYVLMSRLDLVGTHVPLILEPIFGAPAIVATFLMRQFFLSLPRELLDAGRVDGLSELGIFRRIAMPLARPAIWTLAILTFLASWNAFLEPLIFVAGDPDLFTLPIALESFRDIDGTPHYALQMAATALSLIPVVVVFLVAQRFIVEGMSRSGIKG